MIHDDPSFRNVHSISFLEFESKLLCRVVLNISREAEDAQKVPKNFDRGLLKIK